MKAQHVGTPLKTGQPCQVHAFAYTPTHSCTYLLTGCPDVTYSMLFHVLTTPSPRNLALNAQYQSLKDPGKMQQLWYTCLLPSMPKQVIKCCQAHSLYQEPHSCKSGVSDSTDSCWYCTAYAALSGEHAIRHLDIRRPWQMAGHCSVA